jgi:hypothetical protein
MMGAGRAGERGLRVALLESGPSLGRKLLLTSNGRCNVTNAAPLEAFVSAFAPGGGFLRHAFIAFGPEDLMAWLRDRSVPAVQEPGGRIFPASQDARSVLGALVTALRRGKVHVLLRHRATSLLMEAGRLAGVEAGGQRHLAPNVLLATGGLSYPATGSTGDGYELARQADHSIAPTYPAVVALETQESWPRELKGTPVRGACITARGRAGRRLALAEGDAIWTHYGLSGPAVLDVSDQAVRALRRGEEVVLELDMAPASTQDQLHQALRQSLELCTPRRCSRPS